MKICGLTGGIGMGKSTAAGFLCETGVRVVDTDRIARDLVQPGRPALGEIQDAFGKDILTPDGDLRRDELARIVFSSHAARKKLESILHPPIRECWLAQIEVWQGESIPVAFVVIPLLFETQAETHFETIVCAACSVAAQRERLAARDWPVEQIRQRIAAQMPIEQKIARSHHVIWTEGTIEIHRRQVEEILGKI
jgi:dephospho-CoA kinase